MPFLTILIAAAQLATPAPAADRSSRPLQALVRSAGYQQNVTHLFATLPPEVFRRCRSLASAGSQVTVIEPAAFAADGLPTAGSWKQSFPVSGCGNDTTINLFFQARPDEKIESVVAVPGETRGDLRLQHDAAGYVEIAVKVAVTACTATTITDSRYVGPVGAGAGQGWREDWTVAACGHVLRVPVTFIPDATGIVITTKFPSRIG